MFSLYGPLCMILLLHGVRLSVSKSDLLDTTSFAAQGFLKEFLVEVTQPLPTAWIRDCAEMHYYIVKFGLSEDIMQQSPSCQKSAAVMVDKISRNPIQSNVIVVPKDELARQLALFEEGVKLHYAGQYTAAISCYDQVLWLQKVGRVNKLTTSQSVYPPDLAPSNVWFHVGISHQHSGEYQAATDAYLMALEYDPRNVKAHLNIAALYHQHFVNFPKAIHEYRIAVELGTEMQEEVGWALLSMMKSNLGVALVQFGLYEEATAQFTDLSASINDLFGAFCLEYDMRNTQHATLYHGRVSFEECRLLYSNYALVQSHLLHTEISSCDWSHWERRVNFLLSASNVLINNPLPGKREPSPLSSFDSLLYPVNMRDRLMIARHSSDLISAGDLSLQHKANDATDSSMTRDGNNKLKLGFLSYDFNNHPTAHLVEAIFSEVVHYRGCTVSAGEVCTFDHDWRMSNRCTAIELLVYNYGVNDNSSYRRNIENLSDGFEDLAHLSFAAAAQKIFDQEVDILLDMQLHTLGNRLAITARHPGAIQVNYLVYPGTSGASFLDYIVVDRIVAPAEHVHFFTEQYLMLPPTYQVSFQDKFRGVHDEAKVHGDAYVQHLRRLHGLPVADDTVVFCNFNKIDKLDPESFGIWLQILKRVPRSYLWLLSPHARPHGSPEDSASLSQQNTLVKQHLISMALAYGIQAHRLVFADRISKPLHVQRHAAADLFLDTLTYGAHSTATDSLSGGLPVLTLEGGSFPSRVGASLYSSLQDESCLQHSSRPSSAGPALLQEVLVTASVKEYSNTAIHLARPKSPQNSILSILTKELGHVVQEQTRGFFNSKALVSDFIHGMEALQDIQGIKIQSRARYGVRNLTIRRALTLCLIHYFPLEQRIYGKEHLMDTLSTDQT